MFKATSLASSLGPKKEIEKPIMDEDQELRLGSRDSKIKEEVQKLTESKPNRRWLSKSKLWILLAVPIILGAGIFC